MQQQRDTPNSARSTPYSNADSNTKRTNDESKASPWTYTQSYQAPDGSTVFHTTNGSPYCTTTYQQGVSNSKLVNFFGDILFIFIFSPTVASMRSHKAWSMLIRRKW